jgi:hypothetical protein
VPVNGIYSGIYGNAREALGDRRAKILGDAFSSKF